MEKIKIEKKILNKNDKYCHICGKESKLVEKQYCMVYVPTCNCEEEQAQKQIYPFRDKINKLKKAKLGYIYKNVRLKRLNCEFLQECKNYVADFQPRKSKGLFLAGNIGTGKTSLAVGIAKELIFKGYSVKFMVFSQVIRLLQSTYGNKNELSFMEQVENLSQYDLLIFDDIFRENYKAQTLTDVFDFIDYLYKNGNNIVLTANMEQVVKVKEIPEMAAILDRLKQVTKILWFKGESMRGATNGRIK